MLPRIVPSVPCTQKRQPGDAVREPPTLRMSASRPVRVVDVDPGAPGLLRPGRLSRRAKLERADALRRPAVEPAAADVDPVHAVVVEHEVLDLVEVRELMHEREVPVEEVRDRVGLADRALLDQQRRDPPRRRPAPVLVDGERDAAPLGLLDDGARGREVGRERLLGEHVLPGRDRAPDQVDAHVRVGRDVDDLDPQARRAARPASRRHAAPGRASPPARRRRPRRRRSRTARTPGRCAFFTIWPQPTMPIPGR